MKTQPNRALVRLVGRAARRVAPWFGEHLDLVYAPGYATDASVSLYDPMRGARVLSFLLRERLVSKRWVRTPYRASMEKLRRVHSDAYLESLAAPGALEAILGFEPPEDAREEFLESQRLMVGGTLLAARRAVVDGTVAVNLGGGFHHASRDRGAGFCVFNDVAAAVADRRAKGFRGKVLVVDLDVHDGEGTRSLFARDPNVHTLSIHNRHRGPVDVPGSTSVELGDNVEDDRYLEAVREHLGRVLDRFSPDLAFFLAGADPAVDDRLGNWRITAAGMLERDLMVFSMLRQRGRKVPLVVLLAGGYGHEAWRYTARTFSHLRAARWAPEPPHSEEMALTQMRRVARGFHDTDLTGDRVNEWRLSEQDILPSLTGGRGSARFLGYYSRSGIELALERFGLFQRLRSLGFHSLRLEIDTGGPEGDTLSVFPAEPDSEPLIEIRVRRERSVLPGMELLAVDWLLLQNPRARFGAERRPLPGQKRPGLGLLKETAALLVVVCERLELDGVLLVAAHYHLAVQSGGLLRFLRAEDETRFRALQRALDRLPLAEAAQCLERGEVRDVSTGEPVEWKPAAMVMPVSEALHRLVDDPLRREKIAAGARDLRFELSAGTGEQGNAVQ